MPIQLHQPNLPGKLELLALQIVEGYLSGKHKSPFHGYSSEFSEHKAYNPGDPIKNIDWKLYGKTEKYYSKKYEEETNLRAHFLLDCSSSMQIPFSTDLTLSQLNKLSFSASLSAALMSLLCQQRDAFSLHYFNEGITFNSEVKNTKNHYRFILSQLEKEINRSDRTEEKTSISAAVREIALKSKTRALTVVLSDFIHPNEALELLKEAFLLLKHKKHEIIVFHVSDLTTERDFNFEKRATEFIDIESGQKIKLNPNEIKEEIQSELNRRFENIQKLCNELNITYSLCDIKGDFSELLNIFFSRRKKLS